MCRFRLSWIHMCPFYKPYVSLVYPCLILIEANSGMSGISHFVPISVLEFQNHQISINRQSRVCSTTVQDLGSSRRSSSKLSSPLLFPAVVSATQNTVCVLQFCGLKIPFLSLVSVSWKTMLQQPLLSTQSPQEQLQPEGCCAAPRR